MTFLDPAVFDALGDSASEHTGRLVGDGDDVRSDLAGDLEFVGGEPHSYACLPGDHGEVARLDSHEFATGSGGKRQNGARVHAGLQRADDHGDAVGGHTPTVATRPFRSALPFHGALPVP